MNLLKAIIGRETPYIKANLAAMASSTLKRYEMGNGNEKTQALCLVSMDLGFAK
jgi:hypothetical protein